jgi:UDP-hydrolysing UDP-N-acetyl-D-glucosamine 2-epimerase
MRTIGVVTTSRADYGIYRPVLRAIDAEPELRLWIYASGMHLSPEYGMTVEMIERDGYEIVERVEMLLSSDSPEGVAKGMGLGTIGFAQAYARSRPDILLVLGDRFEMHAAVVAALPARIPVAHLHGGETTQGAIDESLRHAITKMSHLHLVATEEYGRRVRQLGEEPWRVTVCGAPALDAIREFQPWSREAFCEHVGMPPEQAFLLVTFHPVTLEYDQTEQQVGQLLAALGRSGHGVLFTMANADTHGRVVNRIIREFTEHRPSARLVDNLGAEGYFSAMTHAAAMVGNSSSGIIEAASFRLPVVNVGRRQHGRVRGENVIDVPAEEDAIEAAIGRATAPEFRQSLADLRNPYDAGGAAEKIVQRLTSKEANVRLCFKSFCDVDQTPKESR